MGGRREVGGETPRAGPVAWEGLVRLAAVQKGQDFMEILPPRLLGRAMDSMTLLSSSCRRGVWKGTGKSGNGIGYASPAECLGGSNMQWWLSFSPQKTVPKEPRHSPESLPSCSVHPWGWCKRANPTDLFSYCVPDGICCHGCCFSFLVSHVGNGEAPALGQRPPLPHRGCWHQMPCVVVVTQPFTWRHGKAYPNGGKCQGQQSRDNMDNIFLF